jgi:hypothetical protein
MSENANPVLSLRLALNTPSADTANAAATEFGKMGLKVEHVSPRGLLVSGAKSVIEQFFGAPIDGGQKIPQFQGEPRFDRLPGSAGYRAYFPREPTYF